MQNQELEQVGGPGMKKKEQIRDSLKEEMAELAGAWEWSTKEWEESNTSFLVREMNKKMEIVVLWIKIRQENCCLWSGDAPRKLLWSVLGMLSLNDKALKYNKTIMSPWGVSWGWYQRKWGKNQSASEIEQGKSRFEWMNWQQYCSQKELSLLKLATKNSAFVMPWRNHSDPGTIRICMAAIHCLSAQGYYCAGQSATWSTLKAEEGKAVSWVFHCCRTLNFCLHILHLSVNVT